MALTTPPHPRPWGTTSVCTLDPHPDPDLTLALNLYPDPNPNPGVEPVICDDKGVELQGECEGLLMIKRPWPSVLRTIYGDHKRYEENYFGPYPGLYFTGWRGGWVRGRHRRLGMGRVS